MISNENRAKLSAALQALDDGQAALLSVPLHPLSRSDLIELTDRLEALDHKLRALQQRLIGRMVAESHRRAGPPGDQSVQLARALRISPAEARRRITEALDTAS
ncbi:DUF222 domain-containing protein [Mycolicibacterium thermoresistibile]